jgi:hypothetical protein
MSHLICHEGKRVVVVPDVDNEPVVRHRSDQSLCYSVKVFSAGNEIPVRNVMRRRRTAEDIQLLVSIFGEEQ